jgi:hypothetical protein
MSSLGQQRLVPLLLRDTPETGQRLAHQARCGLHVAGEVLDLREQAVHPAHPGGIADGPCHRQAAMRMLAGITEPSPVQLDLGQPGQETLPQRPADLAERGGRQLFGAREVPVAKRDVCPQQRGVSRLRGQGVQQRFSLSPPAQPDIGTGNPLGEPSVVAASAGKSASRFVEVFRPDRRCPVRAGQGRYAGLPGGQQRRAGRSPRDEAPVHVGGID